MREFKTVLVFCFLMVTQFSKGQMVYVPAIFDTLPAIRSFDQELPFFDKIRCAIYLFARDFTVRDSLGNIYISLYFDNNQSMDRGIIEPTSLAMVSLSYFFAIQPDFNFVKEAYKNLVIDARYKNGKLFYNRYFPIREYKHFKNPREFLNTELKFLRWPVSSRIADNRFEILYYCMDIEERKPFCNSLLMIVNRLKLIDKKYSIWKEHYLGCNNR